jgi:outer membrane lipoprotein-sorting protein
MFSHSITLSRGALLRGALALGLLAAVGAPSRAAAQALPTAEELLKGMDANMQFETRSSVTTMTVEDAGRSRVYRMRSFGRGQDEAAIEYELPEREKGTRMLKQGDQLWLYLPRAERTQKISGHMLRQGMMGSDVSYEDLMASESFLDVYTAKVTEAGTLDGRPVWRLEAAAKDASVSYPKRVIWVDQATKMPLKQELYALSGMLLKVWTMGDIRPVEGRHVAFRMEVADQLKQGSRTVLTIESVQFGVKLEDEVFSRQWLERK